MTGGIPGVPTGGSMTTENPASSPSSAGTPPNAAQQQLMQQMLQMFAGGGGGGGGSATVHTYTHAQGLHISHLYDFLKSYINYLLVEPDPRGSVPVSAGPAERNGLHQPRGQPAGPHCYWRRHQCRY